MCGAKQLDLLQVCLRSIYINFEKLPQLFIFTDFDVDISRLKKKINWFPAEKISVCSGVDCIRFHREKRNDHLVSFAQKNPMGLKLAAILQVLDSGKPVLYCDTDVIWFNDPVSIIRQYLQLNDFQLVMSEDFQPAYDESLIKNSGQETVYQQPYFCAGILLLARLSTQSRELLERLLSFAKEESTHFTEQTIFAILNRNNDNLSLDKDQFLLKTDDQFDLRYNPAERLVARHYIGPVRHLFWRDALWLK